MFWLSALVAIAGVSFAIGRWSANDPSSPLASTNNNQAGTFAGQGAFAGRGTTTGQGTTTTGQGTTAGQGATTGQGTTSQRQQSQNAAQGGTTGAANSAASGAASTTTEAGSGSAPADAGTTLNQDSTLSIGGGQDAEEAPGQGFGGGRLGGGAFARGGIEGTVADLGDGTLTVTTSQGDMTFLTDANTSYVDETTITAADIQAGDTVLVQHPFTGFDDQASGSTDTPAVATAVTVQPPATDATGAATPDLGTGAASGDQGFGGRGFGGRGITEGTVVGAADGGLIITLADGTSQLIATDGSTRYARDVAATGQPAVGDDVRVQVSRGGFGRGTSSDQSANPLTASAVTIIEAATPAGSGGAAG